MDLISCQSRTEARQHLLGPSFLQIWDDDLIDRFSDANWYRLLRRRGSLIKKLSGREADEGENGGRCHSCRGHLFSHGHDVVFLIRKVPLVMLALKIAEMRARVSASHLRSESVHAPLPV